jgi:hypothetical protein
VLWCIATGLWSLCPPSVFTIICVCAHPPFSPLSVWTVCHI